MGYKVKGKDLNTVNEMVDFVHPHGDPYDMVDRIHELATAVREQEPDFKDQADDLDDAADELDQLFDRIFNTINDEI